MAGEVLAPIGHEYVMARVRVRVDCGGEGDRGGASSTRSWVVEVVRPLGCCVCACVLCIIYN